MSNIELPFDKLDKEELAKTHKKKYNDKQEKKKKDKEELLKKKQQEKELSEKADIEGADKVIKIIVKYLSEIDINSKIKELSESGESTSYSILIDAFPDGIPNGINTATKKLNTYLLKKNNESMSFFLMYIKRSQLNLIVSFK